VLTRNFVPLSLAELIKRLREGKVPNNSVVITFDDGYADNF
jgi:peptidoglycan/xylan/chitin deacetylase (PgdA/CDA1 family)